MRNTIILGLFVILYLFCETRAQPFSTEIVRIEIDGKKVEKNYKVFFLLNGRWNEAERTSTGFVIPIELRNEEYLAVLIT